MSKPQAGPISPALWARMRALDDRWDVEMVRADWKSMDPDSPRAAKGNRNYARGWRVRYRRKSDGHCITVEWATLAGTLARAVKLAEEAG